MALGDILSSALSGLGAAQAGMRTVSNNIANVNTAGYARETVSLQPGVSQGRTAGVVVGEPTRVADAFLESSVYARTDDAGRAEVTAEYLDRMQGMLGAPGAESALPGRLDAVAQAATAMTGGAAGAAQTSAVFIGAVADTISTMQQLDGDLKSLRADADGELGTTVKRINVLLSSIHDLNDTVSRLGGLGRSTSGATDKRMSAIEELSGLIGIVARPQPDGRVAIETNSGMQLLDRQLRQLDYPSSGVGADQGSYAAIVIRFVDRSGAPGELTGEKLDSPALAGKLGGLLDIRDQQIPAFRDKLYTLFGGAAQSLNAASNAGTTVPAPATLAGRATALAAGDRLGFTGKASFAVTGADGTLLAKTTLDFDAMGAGATVQDAIDAINTGLAGSATASFTGGKLTLSATGSGNGIVVAQDAAVPADRGGVGFSHYFGLNDVVRSDSSMLTPSGFVPSDPHGFAAGGKVEFAMRDSSGKVVAKHTLNVGVGTTFGALTADLQSSPMGAYGSFGFDSAGRLRFEATATAAGSSLSTLSDDTNRAGTGRSFSAITAASGASGGLLTAEVNRQFASDPAKLPLARLQDVAIGKRALGAADRTGAASFVDAFADPVDLGAPGLASINRYASTILGEAGTNASRARERATEMTTRRDDAVSRRDNFSGVNMDEELAQLVILQNSYSASARMITTAQQMFDTLLGMVG